MGHFDPNEYAVRFNITILEDLQQAGEVNQGNAMDEVDDEPMEADDGQEQYWNAEHVPGKKTNRVEKEEVGVKKEETAVKKESVVKKEEPEVKDEPMVKEEVRIKEELQVKSEARVRTRARAKKETTVKDEATVKEEPRIKEEVILID